MAKIGFIGCGNMASAMIGGILGKGLYQKEEIIASVHTKESRAKKAAALGIEVVLDNHKAAREAELLILAVKPQFYEEVLAQIERDLTPRHMVVGIAPGKTLSWLEEHSGACQDIARLMPNTPAQVGEGITAVCCGQHVSSERQEILRQIASSFGRAVEVPERLMDAAGAVGGCSPAFVYLFIEAMADAAVAEGMPRQMAYTFASQAVLGSAKMVLETGLHPGVLKDMVTSPAGTTIQGIRMLEKGGFRSSVFEAIAACCEKGRKI